MDKSFFWVSVLGLEFIPTLIQTVTWDCYNWDSLRSTVPDRVIQMVEDGDSKAIYHLIKDEFKEHQPQLVEIAIKDFMSDIQGASGVVAIRSKLYQEVVLAIISLPENP